MKLKRAFISQAKRIFYIKKVLYVVTNFLFNCPLACQKSCIVNHSSNMQRCKPALVDGLFPTKMQHVLKGFINTIKVISFKIAHFQHENHGLRHLDLAEMWNCFLTRFYPEKCWILRLCKIVTNHFSVSQLRTSQSMTLGTFYRDILGDG